MRRLLSGWLIVAALTSSAGAQLLPFRARDAPEEIAIDAASVAYDQHTDTVTAQGAVVIRRGDTEVRADEVRVNRTSSEVFARGNVTVTDPEGALFADQIHLNLDEEIGTLDRGVISSQRLHYSISGDRIEKGLGQSYRIENGKFTSCRCEQGPPSWSIAGKEVEVALRGYGTVRGGTFNILDVPVFYLPHAVFPVSQERQSGLLMPRFSVSSVRGFQVLAPYYWAIDRSQDVTMAADFETGARTGLVGEYRYALSKDFSGEISPSYFNEFFRAAGSKLDPTTPDDRWSVMSEHSNRIGAATLYADTFLVSDDAFLREINTFAISRRREVALRTLPYTASRAGVLQEWDRAVFRLQGTFYQNLIERRPSPDPSRVPYSEGLTLQRLPDAELWGQELVGNRVLASWNVTGSDFQRRDGLTGLRLDARPEVMMPVHWGPSLFGSVRAGFRETAYHLTENEMHGGLRGDDPTLPLLVLPHNQTREIFHLTTEAGTSFSRIYAFDRFGVTKLKHTLEPMVEYTFVPGVRQDELPMFDGADRDNRRSLFTYGVVSRLLAKYAPDRARATDEAATGESSNPEDERAGIHELARLSLTQSFDTQHSIAAVTGKGAADQFSDVNLGLRMQPSPRFSLRASSDYDTSVNDISAASVGFRVSGAGRDGVDGSTRLETRNALGVTYRFITRSLLQQIDSNVQLRLTDTLGFVYASRVDVLNDRFLENYFGLRLISQCDCWAIEFAVVDKTNPQEIEVRAQLTLVGLGSTGKTRP